MVYSKKESKHLQQIKQRFGIVGNSPALNKAIQQAMRVAATDIGVLISGENGSGKELFAKIIHYLSPRSHEKLITVNCGAIPEGTIDSELFGHEKGAFTSALERRKGYFEEADHGIIFLDEIGEMPLHTQPRLLRVLENREYMRVGSSQKRKTDVRVIAATNVDLQKSITENKFREDLYYRIAQMQITIPPLRARGDDIYLLFQKFALDFASTHQATLLQLTPTAQKLLQSYLFPGNVRQLKNIVWQVATLERQKPLITEEVLAKYLPKPPVRALTTSKTNHQLLSERELLYKTLFEMQRELKELGEIVLLLIQHQDKASDIAAAYPQFFRHLSQRMQANNPVTQEHPRPLPVHIETPLMISPQERTSMHTDLSLKEHEKRLIKKALDSSPNHKVAAEKLGISERTLYRKRNEYGI
ncbi:MAG: sigma-54 dependent transcriptional regulator [Bacteroidota bacterium]